MSATSEFFRKIGTEWLQERKNVQGLVYDRQPHTLRGKKIVMVYGGGNAASDAFMWAFRNTPPTTDVLLFVYRGELHAMTNMSRPYYKPIDEALREQRAVSPLTTQDLLDVPALLASIVAQQRTVDTLVRQRLPSSCRRVTPCHQPLVQAFNAVLQMPDLVRTCQTSSREVSGWICNLSSRR